MPVVTAMANIISIRQVHLYRILLVAATMIALAFYILLSLPALAPANTKVQKRFSHMSDVSDLYGYYTEGGIFEGLKAEGQVFTLNKKDIFLLSGAVHYFRYPREYWRNRLEKLKSAGLNSVETYVPWNLHEQYKGKFNFEGNLDILHFLDLAKDVGLFVIFRPGPYICSEWEFGGLPYWLLRDPNMKVRTSYTPFMEAADSYFEAVLSLVAKHQFTEGGSIIAVQVENEYGSYAADKKYMSEVMELILKHGVKELLFTSDGADMLGGPGNIPGVLATVNFQRSPGVQLNLLKVNRVVNCCCFYLDIFVL